MVSKSCCSVLFMKKYENRKMKGFDMFCFSSAHHFMKRRLSVCLSETLLIANISGVSAPIPTKLGTNLPHYMAILFSGFPNTTVTSSNPGGRE